jgi:hypothetical protein
MFTNEKKPSADFYNSSLNCIWLQYIKADDNFF